MAVWNSLMNKIPVSSELCLRGKANKANRGCSSIDQGSANNYLVKRVVSQSQAHTKTKTKAKAKTKTNIRSADSNPTHEVGEEEKEVTEEM